MKSFASILVAFLFLIVFPQMGQCADSIVVENSSSETTFKVEDNGRVLTTYRYLAQSQSPGFWLDETGSEKKGAFFVLDENWMQVQRRAQGFGAFESSVLFINVGAPAASLAIEPDGSVGLGKHPANYPLHMASGAHVTAGGVWTNASSRDYKDNIRDLTLHDATEALQKLNPVTFNYKADAAETYVGFIAEDVPDLVATRDRKGMSPMDVVAVLTKVVQEQQSLIEKQQQAIEELGAKLQALETR